MGTESKEIINELKAIRADLDYLKEHIVDIDLVLTDDDLNSIKKAEEDLKNNKTKKLI
ncbi:MAG TPA: hypothetical protein VJI68_03215 [Candidatus Nanoarchaeia archaeon]|nr:hypothetical protein [Candidatus Nanoarchaeia archaeon]